MSETFAYLHEDKAMSTPLALLSLRRFVRHGTLPQLAAFEAVVRLGSVTRAADALCVAQPTISGHLRKLGEALGVRLFEQHGKRLVPTAAALALLETTREVSAAFARCEVALDALRTPPRSSPQASADCVDKDECLASRSVPEPSPRSSPRPAAARPRPIPATTSSPSTTIPA